MSQIDYFHTFSPQKAIEIKDIGNCAIEGVNDDGLYFYMVVTAVRGEATIATCGPVIPDLTELPDGYKSSLDRLKYNPRKLLGTIYKWLNGAKGKKIKPISQAREITKVEALKQFRNIYDYFLEDEDLSARLTYDEVEENKDYGYEYSDN